MATTRGCFGLLRVGPTPTDVNELTGWSFTETADEIDTSSMGDCTKNSQAGAVKTAGQFDYWWDAADGGQDLLVVGTEVDIELFPGGATGVSYTGTVLILTKGAEATVDTVVTSSATFTVNGALTEVAAP